MQNAGQCVLVTGGAGMLGTAIVRRLAARGDYVRVFDSQIDDLELDTAAGGSKQEINVVRGDVRDIDTVVAACRGIDIVFHAAAVVWNPKVDRDLYQSVNVDGTRNVIHACRRAGVGRLVFTSTMDVVVDGRTPIVAGDESLPYPARLPRDAYSRSKILAERLVLAANSADLATCVLRPTGMYGAKDKYHLPNFLALARRGIALRLGDGTARFSHVYAENAAQAHVLAADRLSPGGPVAGRCYFISDFTPDLNLFEFMDRILSELGYARSSRSIPYRAAYALAAVAEAIAPRSTFNRFSVVQTCVDHTFVFGRARRDFGYEPEVPYDEALARTVSWAKRVYGFAGSPGKREPAGESS